MARLRKVGRVWRRAEARAAAQAVMLDADEGYFTVDPAKVFSRSAPLEIELGAGRGDFIIGRAAQYPERNFLAVELAGAVSRMLAVRCGTAGLENLRVVRMDARPLVNLMLPEHSVSAYHIYFPDPWPKERHHKHRLFSDHFAIGLVRTLARDGILYVATDVGEYAAEIYAMLEAQSFAPAEDRVPGAETTGFARRFVAIGKPIFAASFHPSSSS